MARVLPSRRSDFRSPLIVLPVLSLAAVTLAGCSALSPITTQNQYSASDGVRVDLGADLTGENLLVVTSAQGDPGSLIGALTNAGSDDASVTLAADGASDAIIEVPAGATVLFGSEADAPLEIDTVAVAPGGVLPVTISTPSGGIDQVSIPVLDGTLPQYKTLIPTAPPTPRPTPTAR